MTEPDPNAIPVADWPTFYPRDRWNHIWGGIFMGGHRRDPVRNSHVSPVVVDRQFEAVVSLYIADGSGPSAGVRHIVHEILDAELESGQLGRLKALARQVGDIARTGRRVLVRCEAGLNRSGLVIGLALIQAGFAAPDAVALIRRRRDPSALCNQAFVQALQRVSAELGRVPGVLPKPQECLPAATISRQGATSRLGRG